MNFQTKFGQPRWRQFSHRRAAAAAISLCSLVGLMVSPVSAAVHANSSSHKAKVCHTANGIRVTNADICKGLAFYAGKTMTFVDIGSIGGPFYDPGVALQPLIKQYLGVTLNITPYPTGNSIPGQDALARALPDGLTIGMLNPLNDIQDILTHVPGINFNPARMAYLAQNGPNASPIIAGSNSGYSTFGQVVSASKAGTLKMLTQNTGTLNTIQRTWMGVLGIHPQYISGYAALSAEVTGLIRGDGPMGLFDLSLACGLLQQGKAVVLATSIVPPVGTNCRKYLTNVPTLKATMKLYPPASKLQQTQRNTLLSLFAVTGNPTVTQTSVAGYKVNTLRAALKWIYTQPSYRTTMLQFSQNPTYHNPVQAKQEYIQAYKLGTHVVCFIQGTC